GAAQEPKAKLRRALDAGVERVEIVSVHRLGFVGAQEHIQFVDHLPNLEAQDLADRTGILARGLDRSTDRDGILQVEGQVSLDGLCVAERVETETLNVVGLLS